jgi:hypothetical protein
VDYVLGASATLAAAWFVYLGLARLASLAVAPRPVRADPPTSDLPREPPEVTIVWTVYPSYRRSGQCQPGDLVRLKAYRCCRFAHRIQVLET